MSNPLNSNCIGLFWLRTVISIRNFDLILLPDTLISTVFSPREGFVSHGVTGRSKWATQGRVKTGQEKSLLLFKTAYINVWVIGCFEK